ncbi:MAG: FCD domain-containing protein [Burkholderiales bacterium]|nr:FCD domain-containing protein [Burkholderiales bacterium]
MPPLQPLAPSEPRGAPPAAAAIELLRDNSLVTLAQRELERRIVSGEIAAGTKLNEVEVAAGFGVSRGPVREAFRALGQMGLVRVEKNRGVFVREVSLDEANEFYEVRAALEGLIGRLAARRIAADEIEALRGIVKRMHQAQKATKARMAEAYFALNVEFHDLLARAARNQALLANYRGVINQLDLYRRATLKRGTDTIALSTSEHQAIVEAVAARDEARAERLLAEHVLGSRERLHQALAAPAPAGGRSGR